MATARGVFKLPIFLAPAFAEARPFVFAPSLQRCFSTTARNEESGQSHPAKRRKDANKNRGVSALRSTGPKHKTRAYKYPLPQPAKDTDPSAVPYEMNQEHGLYQFFNKSRDTMLPPVEEDAHGRGWTEKELSKKDFHDLWSLHWTCVKEQNRIATRNNERARLKVGYGELEISERLAEVRETMNNIRKVLLKRHDNYSNGAMLLNNYPLAEIFPDMAASSQQIEEAPEVHINEYSEHGSDASNTILTSDLHPSDQLHTQDKASR